MQIRVFSEIINCRFHPKFQFEIKMSFFWVCDNHINKSFRCQNVTFDNFLTLMSWTMNVFMWRKTWWEERQLLRNYDYSCTQAFILRRNRSFSKIFCLPGNKFYYCNIKGRCDCVVFKVFSNILLPCVALLSHSTHGYLLPMCTDCWCAVRLSV